MILRVSRLAIYLFINQYFLKTHDTAHIRELIGEQHKHAWVLALEVALHGGTEKAKEARDWFAEVESLKLFVGPKQARRTTELVGMHAKTLDSNADFG